ncbi:hypothetical protein TVAG_006800 [Trichomonas vaginalis G3]|uniref:Uncharacterized protein n=1 Tax=Trichomonas vaginalis (strain ATCC PRA-98 / G3) TaxID=412133 RepID=A2FC03_TRIV3|nr:hypothetical protein TVAGG3_0964160 [Trichomonas vaginalis G3]EAX97549.1 hypothetical protein TVAG_006800 [Trichomonas vaginalis G3]KAI5488120.1 hypothetical protein TVAGG3_0964160 [Trichomonas vaginalis G3]|eukprot:XP_001310479.1 hypothetical protein [Trichomonas vaginalis G3]
MSARGELIRPFSTRQPHSSARLLTDKEQRAEREQFELIKQAKEKISIEEIMELKREKQNLIQERNILRAKITRFADLAKRTNSNGSINPRNRGKSRNAIIANTLQNQIDSLTRQIAQKRSETQQLMFSDKAVEITELQEEAKMLFMEAMRLEREKKEVELQYKEAQENLERINANYSSSVIAEQSKQINQLEKEISLQRQRNEILRSKISAIKEEQKTKSYIDATEKVKNKIEEIKKKIQAEKEAIRALDQETELVKIAHKERMENLRK